MKNKLTAIIVTFLRDDYLKICLESLRKTYPEINIIVGDNGRTSNDKKEMCERYEAEYFELPFDCGLCTARNMLVDMVETPYILVGDDDFKYDKNAKVDEMLDFLEVTDDYSLVGGRIIEGGVLRNYQGNIDDNGNHFIYHPLQFTDHEEFIPCDITFNFFVARTEDVKAVRWDDEIKVAYEHSAFFIDFKRAGKKVCFFSKAIVEHKPTLPEMTELAKKEISEYQYYRSRKNDKKRFFKRFGIEFVIDMQGRRDSYDSSPTSEIDFCITAFERPDNLERLLLSIAKYYPNANIMIGDQSAKFIVDNYFKLYDRLYQAGLKNKPTAFNLSYDCGLSYARNFLIAQSKKPYQLILEDDFVFNDKTRIDKLLAVLESGPNIGLVGGAVSENGYQLPFVHQLKREGDVLKHVSDGNNWQELDDFRFKLTGCIPNFFLARRALWSDIKWDEDIKIEGEHNDFFYRLSQTNWQVAYTDTVEINHDKQNTQEYNYMRKRCFLKTMLLKNKLQKIVYQDGYTIELVDGEVRKG